MSRSLQGFAPQPALGAKPAAMPMSSPKMSPMDPKMASAMQPQMAPVPRGPALGFRR